MSKLQDITGQRFSRLVVLERAGRAPSGHVTWKCRCDCGNEVVAYGLSLKCGNTRSCGCIRKEQLRERNRTHDLKQGNESTYNSWANMKSRCNDKNNPDYHYYGGRGITHDPRWADFKNFFEDMGPKPDDSLTIERIDNNGNYCKENCKWGTRKEQARNKSNNRYLTYNGDTLLLSEWADKLGINKGTIYLRLRKGWPLEKVLVKGREPVRLLTYQGETLNLSQWSRKLGLSSKAVHLRLSKGWSVEEALSTPRIPSGQTR